MVTKGLEAQGSRFLCGGVQTYQNGGSTSEPATMGLHPLSAPRAGQTPAPAAAGQEAATA